MSQTIMTFWMLENGDRFRFLFDSEVLVRIGDCQYIIENSSDNRVFYTFHDSPIIRLPRHEENE